MTRTKILSCSISRTSPSYINFPLALGALTLCIIPCSKYEIYTADYEIYPEQSRLNEPVELHYEFSYLEVFWFPQIFWKGNNKHNYPVSELYRTFTADYVRLLIKLNAEGEIHE